MVLVWKAEMSNQHVPWEKPVQRPELYHARTATVEKPQTEIPELVCLMLASAFLHQVTAPWRFLWKEMGPAM